MIRCLSSIPCYRAVHEAYGVFRDKLLDPEAGLGLGALAPSFYLIW